MAGPKERNEALEVLRQTSCSPPKLDSLITELTQISSNIHAAYLFDIRGIELLQKLCILLSGTKPSSLYAGWKEFGIYLQIDQNLINCYEYNFQSQDPTYHVLLAFVQKQESTLNKIIEALKVIKRDDIILNINEIFIDMCVKILDNEIPHPLMKCIMPNFIPNAPFIAKKIATNETKQITAINNTVQLNAIEYDKIEIMKPLKAEICQQKKLRTYHKKVMLTFASDAEKLIKDIAVQLRKTRNYKTIGVLILGEQTEILCTNPEQFIYDSFQQVDYIIPIITNEYLNILTSDDVKINGYGKNIDSKYIKYIYTLMNSNYVQNGCRNVKVRPLIADDELKTVLKHYLMRNPLFQVWVKTSEIDIFIDKIIKN